MSLVFSDTTNKDGIIQHIERELGFEFGEISGNTDRMAAFTADVNLASDDVAVVAAEVGSLWQYDDTNHTRYPIIRADLATQQDYTFTEDQDGFLVNDIYKVMAKFSDTDPYFTLEQEDFGILGAENDRFMNPGSGPSASYDLIANGIFLENTPTQAVSDGLLLFVSREGTKFVVGDTTKKPGFDQRFHYYLIHHVCEKFARIHNLANYDKHRLARFEMRENMKRIFRTKNNAVRQGFSANVESTR